jgi:hypothetical protein
MLSGARIAVWFSCGAASAVEARLTVDRYGAENEVRIVNNPVAEEDADNRRFMEDVGRWLGREIETAINPKWPTCSAVDVWEKERFMSSPIGAPCTRALKKQARQAWELEHKPDWHVLGFTADEAARHARFILTERQNVLPMLIDAGITKAHCFRILGEAGIEIPRVYLRGYSNANCIGCVKANSPTYWNHVRRVDPDVFASRAKQSREIGARLVRVRGERIFLDELNPMEEAGQSITGMNSECGIFCEETQ